MVKTADPDETRCAVVSGGGTGIGLATCRHLLSLGFAVTAVGIDREDALPPGLAFSRLDVTGVIAFLLSKEARYVNGSVYNVDGGYSVV